MKLCKTCKHSSKDMYMPFDTCCRSVRVEQVDLQTGDKILGGWRSTRDEREPGRIMARLTGSCGKEGRFWEAKL